MIDLSQIKFIGGKKGLKDINRDRLHYSFVGIKRDEATNDLQFWLPLGFQQFDNDDFDTVKKFFFSMYRTFKTYAKRKRETLAESLDNQRDGIYEKNGGFAYKTENNEEVVLYSKLNALDEILEGYDELKISALTSKNIRTNQLDYSKIHNYLHKAIYLENDVAFIDEMRLSKEVIIPDSPPILQLFCYIYCEIKSELEEINFTQDQAIELSESFKINYLNPNSGLFEQDTFQETIFTLKEILEEILLNTPYKDEDFWHFYDAIVTFLYGENDFEAIDEIYWGINKFSDVWEDMCQYYMLEYPHDFSDKILYADIGNNLKAYTTFKIAPNPFHISLNEEGKRRKLRPDLVFYDYSSTKELFYLDKVFEIKSYSNDKWVEIICKDDSYKELYFELWESILPKKRRDINIAYPMFDYRVRYGALNRAKTKILKKVKEIDGAKKGTELYIIDYKYMSKLAYAEYNSNLLDQEGKNKISKDIKKQLIYEWSIQKNFNNNAIHLPFSAEKLSTSSEFWIPYYAKAEDDFLKKQRVAVNGEFNKSGIQVFQVNFETLQKHYIDL